MHKFIELITTENLIEIGNLSMYITKAFEIRKKLFISIKYAPHAFIYIAVVLICKCIILNVYMFVYC